MSKPWAFVGLSLCAGLVALGAWSAVHGQAAKQPGDAAASSVPLVIKEPAPREMGANERRIREALKSPTEFAFVEKPLSDVVEFLAEKHEIPIVLDHKALDDAGVGSDTPVTKSLRGVSLASALRLLLKPYDLTFVPEEEVLLLTTLDEAGQRLVTRVHDVRDMLLQRILDDGIDPIENGGPGSMWDYDSLIEVVTSTIGPTTWDAVGGPGSIAAFNGALIFSQTEEIHEQVAALFAEMRRVRSASGPFAVGRQSGFPLDEQGRRLVAYPVALRHASLKGDSLQSAIGGGMAGGGARSGMGNGMGGMGGGMGGGGGGGGFFAVDDETTSVQPLAQLGAASAAPVARPETQPAPEKLVDPFPAVKELAAAITSTVEPNSWQPNGGVGTIRAVPSYTYSGNAGTLVVLQTPAVHAKLKKFLASLANRTY